LLSCQKKLDTSAKKAYIRSNLEIKVLSSIDNLAGGDYNVHTMKTRRKPPAEDSVTQKILKLMDEKDLIDKDICDEIDMGSDLFSRKMSGDRKWSLKDLGKIAPVLGLSGPWEFFKNPVPVPIIRVSGTDGFSYGEITNPKEIEKLQLEGGRVALATVYVLSITDKSMMPGFPAGSRLFAQTETWEEIKDDDLVVFCDNESLGQIYRISFKDNQILLKGMNPEVEDRVLAKNQIKMCDRIFRAEF